MQVDYQEEKGNSGGFTILFFEGEKSIAVYIFYFYVFEILFILERGVRREKERERERHIHVWLPLGHHQLGTRPATQACALTGNRTSGPLVRRLVLNPLSHTSQGHYF